eukprot:g16616.t1
MANTMSSPEVAIREGETHEVTPETPAAVDLTVSEPGAATQSGDASRIRKGSAVLANFPFEGEEAHSVSNARLKELQLCDTELSQEFFQRTTLQALKEEVCRWHKSGDLIEKDLMTIDNLVEELRTKACNQDTGESDTFMSEGPLKGKALVEVLRVQHASRWRLQQVRDGESLFSYCYFTKYVGLGDATMPESTSNLQELQREGVLDVVKWVVNRMSDTAKCSPAVGAAQSFSAAAELPSWVERHRAKLENVSELLNLPELPEVVSKETPRNQTALTAFLELDIKGVTLLALGPLTNVAAAAKADLSKFREVVGKIIVAGDNTKANPFNFRLDPMALDVVLNSGVPIHMVGTCCRPDATQLDGCLDKSLDHPMLLKILEQHPLSLVQDPVTAAYFLAPEIFRIAPLEVRGSADPVSVMEAKAWTEQR